jgi:hypothetical protein
MYLLIVVMLQCLCCVFADTTYSPPSLAYGDADIVYIGDGSQLILEYFPDTLHRVVSDLCTWYVGNLDDLRSASIYASSSNTNWKCIVFRRLNEDSLEKVYGNKWLSLKPRVLNVMRTAWNMSLRCDDSSTTTVGGLDYSTFDGIVNELNRGLINSISITSGIHSVYLEENGAPVVDIYAPDEFQNIDTVNSFVVDLLFGRQISGTIVPFECVDSFHTGKYALVRYNEDVIDLLFHVAITPEGDCCLHVTLNSPIAISLRE